MKITQIAMALILALPSGCTPASEAPTEAIPEPVAQGPEKPSPQNIILFIGDGMGSTHFTVLDQIRGEDSTLTRFATVAMTKTHSDSSLVPDSGASATALAAGIKTVNGALSVMPDGEPVETALEIAEKRGMATGLITTTGFWDATPAAFASHTLSRRNAELIVKQVLSSGVDLVISNGAEKLGVEDRPTVENLAQIYGFVPITSADGLTPTEGKVLALFPGNELDLDHPEAPLPMLTRFAIDQLSTDPDGFFLVVESEGTDTASHRNATAEVLDSLRSLDQAVETGLDFAAENGNTLVLFTGDHETGAFQISPPEEGQVMKLDWFSGDHTGQALPLFAYGPGAERFTGWIDNTDVGNALKEMLGRKSTVVSSQSSESSAEPSDD